MVVKKARDNLMERREKIVDEIFYRLSEEVRKIKESSIDNLENLIDITTKNLERNGFETYLARNARDAVKFVLDFFNGAEKVVKAKSMVSHEIGLNEALENSGIKVYETDLGEIVIQKMKDKPRHLTMPAIHVNAEKAFEIFGVENFEQLRMFLRKEVKKLILEAEGGITGANVVSADGSIFIMENEGNARLVSSIPERVVTITGVEKIVDTMDSAMKVSQLIWKSAGYYNVSFLNIVSGLSKSGDIEKKIIERLHGPLKHAVVLIDNGRIKAKDTEFREALYCVKCGACLFSCPSYQALNADWGRIYSGGIGTIWDFITGSDSNPYLCVGCGSCVEICPLKINVPEMLRKLKSNKIDKIN